MVSCLRCNHEQRVAILVGDVGRDLIKLCLEHVHLQEYYDKDKGDNGDDADNDDNSNDEQTKDINK